MKRWILMLLMCLCCVPLLLAQETTAEPPMPLPTPDVFTQSELEIAVLRAEQAADTAEQSVNISGNLLNLFDAIALLLTVFAVILGAVGFRSFQDSRRVSNELREEATQLRQQFEAEITKREEQLEQVRLNIEVSSHDMAAQLQRRTDNALVATSLLALGERQYRASDYDGAIDVYSQALRLDPDNPIIHQRLGYVYCQQGNINSALHHYSAALKHSPDLSPAMAGLGFVTRRIAEKLAPGVEQDLKYLEAEQHLLKALKRSPKLVDDDGESWWGVLGGLYRRRGYIDKAIVAYEQATNVTPQSSYGYGNLALLYMKKGDRARMEHTYQRMLAIAVAEAMAIQGNFWGYADLVVSRLALGQEKEVAFDLPVAINIAPKDADWMLEGLRDTLADLKNYLDAPRIPAITNAIQAIEHALHERQNDRLPPVEHILEL